MVNELNVESIKAGLRMDTRKTSAEETPILIKVLDYREQLVLKIRK